MANLERKGEERGLNINVTLHPDSDTWDLLNRIFLQGKKIMAAVDDMRAELGAINEATNEIASDVEALINRVPESGGLSAADAQAIRGEMAAVKDKLKGVAAQYPVVVVEPPPPPVEEPPVDPTTPSARNRRF